MLTLINNTTSVSRIGFVVSLDTRNTQACVYATPGATKAVGVFGEAVAYRKPAKVLTQGDKALVYVNANVNKGDVIRLSKAGDNITLGGCTVAKTGDVPYLKIGEAITSGRGLISVVLDLIYTTSDGDTHEFLKLDQSTPQTTTGTFKLAAANIGGAANYIDIDSSGEMTFNGTATVWDDIRIIPNIFDVPGGSDPDVISYQPAGSGATFKVYAFAKGDEGFFTIQLPHSYKEGSTLYAHVHWTPGTRGNEENGNVVQWRLDYSFAAIGGTFPASQTCDLSDACDGTDHKHQKTQEVAISGVGLGISSQMWGRVYRWNDASDTWVGTGANLPIFIEIDIHYEQDTVGSKTKSSK